jgi:uncharacterized protein (DUF169 family)
MAFIAEAPAGLPKVSRAEAAGCGYWKLASEGRSFYTTPADHGNCPIGAFTHGVELSGDQRKELNGLVGTMIQLKYLKSNEVQSIPHRVDPMRVAVYAPLERASFAPDVVLFCGNARQIMLVTEAARHADAFDEGAMLSRPACAMIPQALGSRSGVASVGCIGNRVYTGLGDDELYVAVPGAAIEEVLTSLDTILKANAELEKFHRARAATMGPEAPTAGEHHPATPRAVE